MQQLVCQEVVIRFPLGSSSVFWCVQTRAESLGNEQKVVGTVKALTRKEFSNRAMKRKQAVLEYCATPVGGRRGQWGFRFKDTDGRIVMDSRGGYPSLNKAERGFVSLVKSIASNQYSVAVASRRRPGQAHRAAAKRVLR